MTDVLRGRRPLSGDAVAGASSLDGVARVLLSLLDMPEPPRRPLLGRDAVSVAGAARTARAESDERWRELSESTSAS